jgi:cellulose synthase/poly-beta-1,6-N-acetylglucosamine synthase-like glycosyltransferase
VIPLASSHPFPGLPEWLAWLFVTEFAVVVAGVIWVAILFVRSELAYRRAPEPLQQLPTDLLWIFLVPALNEETTIEDSVRRLLGVDVPNRVLLVVDDGSTDGTPELLAGIEHPDLAVLRRDPPEAQQGKAAALNAAWRHIEAEVLQEGRFAGWPRDRVVVGIVDADGRLGLAAPLLVAAWFANARVGGVQLLVRIYNRHRPLTWCQDVEFSIYAQLYQLGRVGWGTAGMGGNGQFNRLSALDDVADEVGPWRDRLTEDQDLGLRLIEAGWHNAQEVRGSIDQQGLSSLVALYRQRTRWAQGGLQAFSLLRVPFRAPISLGARFDLLAYLLLPVLQAIVGLGLVTAIAIWIFAHVPLFPDDLATFVFFLAVGFGGPFFGLFAIGRGSSRLRRLATTALFVLPYVAYSWLIFPVLVRAALRQLIGRGSWAKTAREPLGLGEGVDDAGAPVPDEERAVGSTRER